MKPELKPVLAAFGGIAIVAAIAFAPAILEADPTVKTVQGRYISRVKAAGTTVSNITQINFSTNLTATRNGATPDQLDVTASGGGGGSNYYQTVLAGGSAQNQEPTINLIGSAITCADNVAGTRTDCTWHQSPSGATNLVGDTRTITCGNALTGCGNLSADRTLAVTTSPASQTPVGVTRAVNTSHALSGGGALSSDLTLDITTSPVNATTVVGTLRTITCGNSITGCGDLSTDRTLDVTTSPASQTAVGVTRTLTCGNALTGCGDLSANRTLAVTTSPSSQTPVGTTRQVATDATLTGGGDLSADRTIGIDLTHANTWTGAQTVNAAFTQGGQRIMTVTNLGPLSGTTNDWNIGNASIVRVTLSGSQNLTGIAGGVAGRIVTICNVTSAATLTIQDLNAGSQAANQISGPANTNFSLTNFNCITLWYDGTSSFWRTLEHS